MGVSKQLLPIYDKPMIYYPLSVLMLGGIREICVITTPQDQDQFIRTLGDGSQWGISLSYVVQPSPDGLAQAYLLARGFPGRCAQSAMVLGDNIFFGHGLPELLAQADAKPRGGTVFGYHVADPERYGVVAFDADGPGHRDHRETRRAALELRGHRALFPRWRLRRRGPATVQPSARGEVEITSLLEMLSRRRGCWRSSAWGAALPGSTPAPMAACWTRAISCAP